jgi:hypothetical protein
MNPRSIFDHLYVWLVLAIGLLFFVQISRAESARRFESFRWDVEKHELTCTVSLGRIDKDSGTEKYVPEKILDYVISMDEGHVTLDKEVRDFSRYEAALMHRVIDLVLQYSVESVEWFEGTRGSDEHHKVAAK